MFQEARTSTASVMKGLVLEDCQCWSWGGKNHSPSHLLCRAISTHIWAMPWLHALIWSGAITEWRSSVFPQQSRNLDVILCHGDCSCSVLAGSPYLQHNLSKPSETLWVRPGHQERRSSPPHLILKNQYHLLPGGYKDISIFCWFIHENMGIKVL